MATSSLTFQVPLPPRELSPNGRKHWAQKAGKVKDYRDTVRGHARVAVALGESLSPTLWPANRAAITLTFCLRDRPAPLGALDRATHYHPTDPDNAQASFKAGLDGLRDAGVVIGDEWDRVALSVAMTKERGPWIEVCVTALPAEARE